MTELAPVAVVVTQVGSPVPLAAACALGRIPIDAVPSPVGALGVCREASGDGPQRAAETISRLLRTLPVVLVEHVDGQITSSRWTDGVRADMPAPGLWLDAAPELLEDLLTGTVAAVDVEGVISSAGMSRWKAARLLARSARLARKG